MLQGELHGLEPLDGKTRKIFTCRSSSLSLRWPGQMWQISAGIQMSFLGVPTFRQGT